MWLIIVNPSFLLWLGWRILAVFGEEIEGAACVILRWNGSSTNEGFHAVLSLQWKMWWKSWKFSWLKTRIGAHGLLRLALLLDVINRNQRNSSMLDCNLLIWGFICNVLVGDFVCLIFVWHFFVSTDNVRQFFFPVILVYFIVVLWRRLTCMACYFTGDIVRLTRLLQFWHQCFPQAVVSQLIIRPETRGYGFHYIADGVLPH